MDQHCSRCGNQDHTDSSCYCQARDEGDHHEKGKQRATLEGNQPTRGEEDTTDDEEECADDSYDEWDSED